jgi:hypothetical protein
MGKDSSGPQRRLIEERDKARFLSLLREGTDREEAASAAGFPLGSFYNVRKRDSVFRLGWEWAMDLAAIDERGGELSLRAAAGDPSDRIAPKGGRLLQRQKMRWVKFTAKRQQSISIISPAPPIPRPPPPPREPPPTPSGPMPASTPSSRPPKARRSATLM